MILLYSYVDISIHAPREGGDIRNGAYADDKDGFQSTPPARGATEGSYNEMLYGKFQSTPPARGATSRPTFTGRLCTISIHAPREGGDCIITVSVCVTTPFQSTPPARGATTRQQRGKIPNAYFNPRPPRGGRRKQSIIFNGISFISIHAPREGGDSRVCPIVGNT